MQAGPGVPRLAGWTWDPFESQWEDGFTRLEAYVAGNRSSRVSDDHKAIDGFKLGKWVNKQRAKRDTMPADRKRRLEALPGWTWHAFETRWEEGFARLEAYVAGNRSSRVPDDHKAIDGFKLGGWVQVQRATRTTMPADRKSRLEALPGWTWDAKESRWEEGFARLEAYVAENGHCLVPAKHVTSDGYRLGSWVNVQRTHHGRPRPDRVTMSSERKSRLEALPRWTWDARPISRGAVKNAEDDGGTS